MFYLKIAHTNDNDCDLFRFETLDRAYKYIIDNDESEWILTDILDNEFEPEDYTLII